jgi:hypothetical protein
VERLEEVRLPRAVRARDEHEAGSQLEVEAMVGAEVEERELADDER